MHPFRPTPTEVRSSTLIPEGVSQRHPLTVSYNTNMPHKPWRGIGNAPCLLSLLCPQGGQLSDKTESGGGYKGQGSGLKVRDSHLHRSHQRCATMDSTARTNRGPEDRSRSKLQPPSAPIPLLPFICYRVRDQGPSQAQPTSAHMATCSSGIPPT